MKPHPELTQLIEHLLHSGAAVRVRVTGPCMRPFLRSGEVVTLVKTPVSALQKGDLVLFKSPMDTMILHRIVGIFKQHGEISGFQTQGDAVRKADDPVSPHNILAKVLTIQKTHPYLGVTQIDMNLRLWRAISHLIMLKHRCRKSALYCALSRSRMLLSQTAAGKIVLPGNPT